MTKMMGNVNLRFSPSSGSRSTHAIEATKSYTHTLTQGSTSPPHQKTTRASTRPDQ